MFTHLMLLLGKCVSCYDDVGFPLTLSPAQCIYFSVDVFKGIIVNLLRVFDVLYIDLWLVTDTFHVQLIERHGWLSRLSDR